MLCGYLPHGDTKLVLGSLSLERVYFKMSLSCVAVFFTNSCYTDRRMNDWDTGKKLIGSLTVLFGHQSVSIFSRSVSIGSRSVSIGSQSVSIGSQSVSIGSQSVSIVS
jgi:hypothetical protein